MEKSNGRFDFRLENDSTMIISGPSKCGKTTFVIDLIRRKQAIFKYPIRQVWWFHGAAQGSKHDILVNELHVTMKEGIPNESDLELIQQHDLVVLDDLQNETKEDAHITSFFLKHAHHKQFFAIQIQQNIYGDREQRFRYANVHYYVAFNNPRNHAQIINFLSRMYPSGQRGISAVYNHVLTEHGNYAYLFVDFCTNTLSDLRLRTHIFTSPIHVFTLNTGSKSTTFRESFALSTLDAKTGSVIQDYSNMVLLDKPRYQSLMSDKSMSGGSNKAQLMQLLEPGKAYAVQSAKELADYKITPNNVSDYYRKLIDFNKIRREFFIPKPPPPSRPPPPTTTTKSTSMTPHATKTTSPPSKIPRLTFRQDFKKTTPPPSLKRNETKKPVLATRHPNTPLTTRRKRLNPYSTYGVPPA